MSFHPQQRFCLRDAQDHDLGQVVITQVDGELVFGDFTPGNDYGLVGHLFAEYVAAANQQLLSVVGELDEAISTLGLHAKMPGEPKGLALHDVQIGEGVITFRQPYTPPPTPRALESISAPL